MRATPPFSWLATPGWLVLSGSADALSEVRARALSRCDASGAIAYISFANDLGDSLMDDMAELGAVSGYLVDLNEADNNAIYERLSTAAMIVIEAPSPSSELPRLLRRTAAHAMKEALQGGALLLLEGAAAAEAGEFAFDSGGQVGRGLGYVRNALIAAESYDSGDGALLSAVRRQMPETTFVSLPPGSALVLGPGGLIETWGERQAAISLGNLSLAEADVDREAVIE